MGRFWLSHQDEVDTVEDMGEKVPVEVHSTLNLGLDIRIPPEYITDEHQRLRAYKRIADAATVEQGDELLAELEDRYGPAPDAVRYLLKFSVLKTNAQKLGIEAIDRRQGVLNVKFHQEARVDPNRLMDLVRDTEGAQFTPAGVLRIPLDGASNAAKVLDLLEARLVQLQPKHA